MFTCDIVVPIVDILVLEAEEEIDCKSSVEPIVFVRPITVKIALFLRVLLNNKSVSDDLLDTDIRLVETERFTLPEETEGLILWS